MQKKTINDSNDFYSSEESGKYTYRYTFSCSVCGRILKEVTTHSFDASMSYNGRCPNGCLGAINKRFSVIEAPVPKYSKANPYKGKI